MYAHFSHNASSIIRINTFSQKIRSRKINVTIFPEINILIDIQKHIPLSLF
jgi:hypothetical protein